MHIDIYPPFVNGGEGGFLYIVGTNSYLFYNKELKEPSRQLRNNSPDAERLLWSNLRKKQLKGYQFYRQKIIGRFIVDFYCPKATLVIEVDGDHHRNDVFASKDCIRDSYMENHGLKVLRLSNRKVLTNLESVLETIYMNLKSPFNKGGDNGIFLTK